MPRTRALSGLRKENIRFDDSWSASARACPQHAESFAREDFLSGPSNQPPLGLSNPGRMANPANRAHRPGRLRQSQPCSPSGPKHGRGAIGSARALDPAAVPRRLARGALVSRMLPPMASTSARFFHLLNLAREQQAFVLPTRARHRQHGARNRDLGSRLRALPSVCLAPPDDTLLRAFLVKLFATGRSRSRNR